MLREPPFITESAIPELLRDVGSPFGPGVKIRVESAERAASDREVEPDFLVLVRCSDNEYKFLVEAKAQNSPRALEDAIRQARRWSASTRTPPMVVVPFLDEERLERLEREGISGLDLSGNGLIMVPGKVLLRATGRPNRYPDSRSVRSAYRGATSLVARVFLRKRSFGSVGEVLEEIERAGGSLVLSTVSKGLARMAEDVIIDRSEGRIVLLQPDKLLDLLAESFAPPRQLRSASAKLKVPLAELSRRVNRDSDVRLVVSGLSSQLRYSAGLRADQTGLYCSNLAALQQLMIGCAELTDRFADITIAEVDDTTAFFDTRTAEDGVVYASPLQTYLELNASPDKRDREMARQARERVLSEL